MKIWARIILFLVFWVLYVTVGVTVLSVMSEVGKVDIAGFAIAGVIGAILSMKVVEREQRRLG